MFAVLFVTGLMLADGPVPPRHVDTRSQQALAQAIEQARRDFELRHAELGLLGAAPLVGRERPKPALAASASQRTESERAVPAPAPARRHGSR